MQIACVALNIKTSKEAVFDYAILPSDLALIKIGVLVLVPFHNRKILGVIIDLKPRSKILNLKTIIKIVDPTPVIDDEHIKLSLWISKYYLSSFGKTLFLNIPPPAMRSIISHNKNDQNDSQKSIKSSSMRGSLVFDDFQARMKIYRRRIYQTLTKNQSVLILIPDLDLLKYFEFPGMIQLHAELNRTERWKNWDKIRSTNRSIVVIGSQSALFAPINNLGLIIIDQEENSTYKNDREPRYFAKDVALQLAKLSGAEVMLGSACPSIESYFQFQNRLISRDTFIQRSISIVDMNFSKTLISPTLEEQIHQNLSKQIKIVLFLDRKGEGIKFICSDCSWFFSCPSCHTPLIPDKVRSHCWRCQKEFVPPTKCPACCGVNLKITGATTSWLEKRIQKLFPKARLIRLENDSKIDPMRTNWDIAIATSFALKFRFPPISLVGIIDADLALSFPDFRSLTISFTKQYKFLKLAKQGIIQTHLPQSSHIKALARLNYGDFYKDELSVRKKFNFPPICKIIRIIYKNNSREVAEKETQKMSMQLKEVFKNNDKIFISDNSPTFIQQKNKYFYWQIIIKIAGARPKKIEEILLTLGKGWVVDVDPIEML